MDGITVARYLGFKALSFILHTITGSTVGVSTLVSIKQVANALLSFLNYQATTTVFLKFRGNIFALPAYTDKDRMRLDFKLQGIKLTVPDVSNYTASTPDLGTVMATSSSYDYYLSDKTYEAVGSASAPPVINARYTKAGTLFNGYVHQDRDILTDNIPAYAVAYNGQSLGSNNIDMAISTKYRVGYTQDRQSDRLPSTAQLNINRAQYAVDYYKRPWLLYNTPKYDPSLHGDLQPGVNYFQDAESASKVVESLQAIIQLDSMSI